MKNTVVVGAQWGDEGKAKVTDLLAQNADMIIRYQGGCNAGHTVVVDEKTYKFHLVPSGILYKDKICYIGPGTVIHPEMFMKEILGLVKNGIDLSNLKISPLASITMPYHLDIENAVENDAKTSNKIGTTKKGIGPTYTDKMARVGFKIQDLYSPDALKNNIFHALNSINPKLQSYGLKPYSKYDIELLCHKYAEYFAPYIDLDWQETLYKYKKEKKTILFEGAQGVMLDVDYGTYPFVTSSNPIAGGAAVGSGYGPSTIEDVIGVSKAYMTRVGEGSFITELTDEIGEKLREIGHEYGTTTGRPRRCGWFDAVVAKYAVLVSGLTSMAITKLDVFDDFDEIKICTAYKDTRTGKISSSYPTQVFEHKFFEPIYEVHKGWKCDISNVRNYDDLPQLAKDYLKRLEELFEIPISIISVGPDREQTIFL